jgi:hypothetical protein
VRAILLAVALFLAPAVAALLAACAGAPTPPDWQLNAHASLRNFTAAYFAGNAQLAAQEFARARAEIASTGRADLLARAELLRCAAQVASLAYDDCPGYQALAADAGATERCYAQFLSGRWQGLKPELLPAQHRALLERKADADAGALMQIADPASRLVAAGVLFRLGRIAPTGIAAAIDTASAQGWRRPLLAWLEVQARRADASGENAEAARIRRRIALVLGAAAAP